MSNTPPDKPSVQSEKSPITLNQIVSLIKATASSWVDDYAPSMGAALSYYTLFSIAPLLLIVISIAGLMFGEEAARGEIFGGGFVFTTIANTIIGAKVIDFGVG